MEQRASAAELGQLLEEAVLDLPEQYRTVIMPGDVEELSTAETAAALELTEQNVKGRLHRGRAMMRDRLFARVGASGKMHSFMGVRCDRVVLGVFARLRKLNRGSLSPQNRSSEIVTAKKPSPRRQEFAGHCSGG